MTYDEMIEWIAPVAQEICGRYGLYPSVCIAQACIESGWGRYTIGEYNLFGRKWGGWGRYLEKATEEYIDGEWITIVDKFQDYDSLEEAINDWCVLMTQEPVYVNNIDLSSVDSFVNTMAPIYATNPRYAQDILVTISANNLEQYDA